jgi:DNA-binding transcriptional LysR family regulator
MDTLNCIRAFIAVAKKASFTAGAKQINISTKLASKYVKSLEDRLGAQLFNRTTRSVTLTDTGQAYLRHAVLLLEQFDELEDVVHKRQSELAGLIRITAPTALGSDQLVDIINPFLKLHPKVSIDLQLTDQRSSVVEDGFDLAIRFGALEDSNLVARKLMNMRLVVVASPSYIENNGLPSHPSALATHNCLLQTASINPDHWAFLIDEEVKTFKIKGSFQANSPKAVSKMALNGLGIARCPIYVADSHIQNGDLIVLFEEMETDGFILNAIYPPSRHLTSRIRALIDFLVISFKTI